LQLIKNYFCSRLKFISNTFQNMIRKVFAFLFLALFTSNLFAQFPSKKDSGYKKMDYFHFETSWLTWLGKPDSNKVKALSHNFSVYVTYPLQLGKSKINFVPGLGISVDNIYTNSRPKMDSARTKVWLAPIASSISYKNSKETFTYLTVPVAFYYNAKGNSKSWKASLGFRFNYLIGSDSKYKGNDVLGNAEKIKTLNFPFANRYRLDASFTLGYDFIYFVANYGFTSYIASGMGPQFQPLTFGVGVVGF